MIYWKLLLSDACIYEKLYAMDNLFEMIINFDLFFMNTSNLNFQILSELIGFDLWISF